MGTSNARKMRREAARNEKKDLESTIPASIHSSVEAASEDQSRVTSGLECAAKQGAVKVDLNKNIEIRDAPGKGRGLFWASPDGKAVEEGTTLLSCDPFMKVLNGQAIHSHCHVCFDATKRSACSGCQLVRYCSLACRDKDKLVHQIECKALQGYGKSRIDGVSDPGPHERLTARLIWEHRRLGDEWWIPFEALACASITLEQMKKARTVEAYMEFAPGDTPPSTSEVIAVIRRVGTNAFDCKSASMRVDLGVCIEVVGSYINHSCEPNVALSAPEEHDKDKPLHWVAIKKIEAGEELLYGYIEPHMPYSSRQADLMSNWSFTCHCTLCRKTENFKCPCIHCSGTNEPKKGVSVWIDPREAFICQNERCDGLYPMCPKSYLPAGGCSKCGKPNVMDEIKTRDALQEGSVALKSIIVLDPNDKYEAKRIVKMGAPIMKKLSAIQASSACPFFQILRKVTQAVMTVQQDQQMSGNSIDLVHVQLTRIAAEAMVAGLFPPATGSRWLTMYGLGMMYAIRGRNLTNVQIQSTEKGLKNYTLRPPKMPQSRNEMISLGISYLESAVTEAKAAMGKEVEGGVIGREINNLLTVSRFATRFMV